MKFSKLIKKIIDRWGIQKICISLLVLSGTLTYLVGLVIQVLQNSLSYFTGVSSKIVFNPFVIIPKALFGGGGILAVLIIGSLLLLCLYVLYVYKNISTEDEEYMSMNDTSKGSAKWMDYESLKKEPGLEVGPIEDVDGIIVGRVYDGHPDEYVAVKTKRRGNSNIAVFGTPGAGKSVGLVHTNIAQIIKRGDSAVIIDPKEEAFMKWAAVAEKNGYKNKVLHTIDLKKSDTWNPIPTFGQDRTKISYYVSNLWEAFNKGIEQVGDAKYFSNAAEALLSAIILYLNTPELNVEHYDQSLYGAYEFIMDSASMGMGSNESNTYNAQFNNISKETKTKEESNLIINGLTAKFGSVSPDHPARQEFIIFQNFGKLRNNVISSLLSKDRLKLFDSPEMQNLTSSNTLGDYYSIVEEKTILYIVTDSLVPEYSFLTHFYLRTMVQELIKKYRTSESGGKTPRPLNFILDEFLNIGRLPEYPAWVAELRSVGLRFMIINQDLNQFCMVYGEHAANSILACHDTQIKLSTNDKLTAEYFSFMLGKGTIKDVKYGTEHKTYALLEFIDEYNKMEGLQSRSLRNPDEVNTADPDEWYVIGYSSAIRVRSFVFSEHPYFRDIREINLGDYQGKKRELGYDNDEGIIKQLHDGYSSSDAIYEMIQGFDSRKTYEVIDDDIEVLSVGGNINSKTNGNIATKDKGKLSLNHKNNNSIWGDEDESKDDKDDRNDKDIRHKEQDVKKQKKNKKPKDKQVELESFVTGQVKFDIDDKMDENTEESLEDSIFNTLN